MPFIVRGAAAPAHAAAPMLGESRPIHFRFKLGDFEVTTLFDGSIAVPDGPHPIFGNDQPKEAVQEFAREERLPPDKLEIMFTPVIVNTGSELVLFDTGNPAARRPSAGQLLGRLKAAGYSPDQIDIVVLTHFHGDHIGGLMENEEPRFPNARYVTNQVEYDFWTHPDRMSGPTEGGAKLVEANVKPLAEKTTFLGDGGDVVTGIRAVAAYGHTPGHTAFHVESNGKRLFIGGDFTNHYALSLARPEWLVSFDVEKEKAVETRKRLLDMLATDAIPFTSYHMPFPAVGYIEKSGEAYRWVPASYQLHL
jgi:glyoxylase-like metal-dependent hydrolase (beta-lactamase superfamily II)